MLYRVEKDEHVVLEGMVGLNMMGDDSGALDFKKQRLYANVWQQVAEMLGTGKPCKVQFTEVINEPDDLFPLRRLRLRVLIAPLHEQEEAQTGEEVEA